MDLETINTFFATFSDAKEAASRYFDKLDLAVLDADAHGALLPADFGSLVLQVMWPCTMRAVQGRFFVGVRFWQPDDADQAYMSIFARIEGVCIPDAWQMVKQAVEAFGWSCATEHRLHWDWAREVECSRYALEAMPVAPEVATAIVQAAERLEKRFGQDGGGVCGDT